MVTENEVEVLFKELSEEVVTILMKSNTDLAFVWDNLDSDETDSIKDILAWFLASIVSEDSE